jgi:hypothetical protein
MTTNKTYAAWVRKSGRLGMEVVSIPCNSPEEYKKKIKEQGGMVFGQIVDGDKTKLLKPA